MNWLDVGIAVFLVASLVRGVEVGFVRQIFSTVGFLSGLAFGAWLQAKLIHMANAPESKVLLVLVIVLGSALLVMTLGEYIGLRLKLKLRETRFIERLDRIFGSIVAGVTLLAAVWLGAAIFRTAPSDIWREQIGGSRVIATLNSNLPPAPNVIAQLGHLINPNIFPQVFTGLEPSLRADAPLPDVGDLRAAVEASRESVVQMQGVGCGGVVTGSAFVAAPDLLITNAHVVSGVRDLKAVDVNGAHDGTVVWFDPKLDLAIVRATGLAGKPLPLETSLAPSNTPAVVLGYPLGQGFTVRPATILETFKARGRDIYNQRPTERQVYAIAADVRQGNSGGPLITADGSVIGVIFAQSTSYDRVGYAFTIQQAVQALQQSTTKFDPTPTGGCTAG